MVSAAVLCLLVIPIASAIETVENQKEITVNAEKGEEYVFSLLLRNVGEPATISASGNASSWVTFGGDNEESYHITNLVNQSLRVTVFVPNDVEVKDYFTEIKAGDTVISKVTIAVSEPFPTRLNAMSSRMEELSDEFDELKSRQTDLESQANKLLSKSQTVLDVQEDLREIYEQLQEEIFNISTYQESIEELENRFDDERNALTARISDLETQTEELTAEKKEMTTLTGQIAVGYTSVSFSLGLIAGILIVVFYSGKGRDVSNAVRRVRAPRLRLRERLKRLRPETEKKYKYSYE